MKEKIKKLNIDILYIHPSKSFKQPLYLIFPAGIVGLLNLLKEKGYTIRALNYGVEIALNNKFNLENYLSNKNCKIVAIDMHWFEHTYAAVELTKICKKINPNCKVIIGGFTASIFAEEIINTTPTVDFVIKGEAEYPFIELCEYILTNKLHYEDIPNLVYRKNNKCIITPFDYSAANIDSLNFIDIEFFEHHKLQYEISDLFHGIKAKKPSFFIYLQRGCIYDCSTCGAAVSSHRLIFKEKKFITRRVDKVFSDIKKLAKDNVKRVYVVGDLTLCDKNYWQELFRKIREENLDITIHNDVYQLPSYEFIDEFVKTFEGKDAKLILTPLCGDEEVRMRNGKLFTNNQLLDVVNYMQKKRIKTDIFFQVYLPYETNETFQKTIQLAAEMSQVYDYKSIWFRCDQVRLDPGSPMRFNQDKFAIYHNLNHFIDYYHYSKTLLKNRWSFDNLLYYPKDKSINLNYMQRRWVAFKTKIFIRSIFDKETLKRRIYKNYFF